LDKFVLGSSESSSVGDIEDTIVSLGMLSVDSSDLDEVLISNGVEFVLLLHQLWKLDVDGSSEGSSEVCWARGDVSEMFILGELAHGLNNSGSSAESIKDLLDSGSLLHGDDSELILLVDPDEESLFIVMENTSS